MGNSSIVGVGEAGSVDDRTANRCGNRLAEAVSVRHFCTYDVRGGAGIAAYRLHQGLCRLGVNSRMSVYRSWSGDPSVEASPPLALASRAARFLGRQRLALERRRYARTESPTLEAFSDDRVPGPDLFAEGLPRADVYNLHWVARFVDYRRFFRSLPAGTPLVWTLHDMNPFTGGCHYAMACKGYATSCGSCPQLGSDDSDDLTARIHRRKRNALQSLVPETTRIVAPSRWLASAARRSTLAGRFDVETIPNGVDTDVFRPVDRRVAREALDLPQDRRIVLFVADILATHRKGFDLLCEALRDLPRDRAATLVAIGENQNGTAVSVGPAHWLGRIDDPRRMALAMSAADLFVLPTRADNLPNVLLEAIACGTPVVSFDVGGVPDTVQPRVTGLLAAPEDVAALRAAVVELLADDELRARMSAAGRRTALEKFSLEVAAGRYSTLYETLLVNAEKLRDESLAARLPENC